MIDHRPANEDDAEGISALISSFAPELVSDSAGQDAAQYLASVSATALRGHLASGRYSFTVAHDDGRIVGVIAVLGRTHLSYFFVDRAYQRRGIGRQLWDRARMESVSGGHSGSFHVFATLNAVPVYSRFGFRVTGLPSRILGVKCVPMAFGDTPRMRSFSVILPSEQIYPALNKAAEEIRQALGAAVGGISDERIHERIAAAACLAGSILLREADAASRLDPEIQSQFRDFRSRQSSLLLFMELHCRRIDPLIDQSLERMAGRAGEPMSGGWLDDVPPEHAALFDVDALIGKLWNLSEFVADQHGVPPVLRAHMFALAAMKLIASAHSQGLLDQRAGRALVRFYMAAGCKAPPVHYNQIKLS